MTCQISSIFTLKVLKIEAELEIFHYSRKHLLVLHHARFHGYGPKNHIVTAIYTLGTLNIPLIIFSMNNKFGNLLTPARVIAIELYKEYDIIVMSFKFIRIQISSVNVHH